MTAAEARMLAAKAAAKPLSTWQGRALADLIWKLDNYEGTSGLSPEDRERLEDLAR